MYRVVTGSVRTRKKRKKKTNESPQEKNRKSYLDFRTVAASSVYYRCVSISFTILLNSINARKDKTKVKEKCVTLTV